MRQLVWGWALCLGAVASLPLAAAGVGPPLITAIIPDGGSLPTNAVLFAETTGTAFAVEEETSPISVNGVEIFPEFSPPSCIVGTTEGFGGWYRCLTSFSPGALSPASDVVLEVGWAPDLLEYSFVTTAGPDEAPPVLEGAASGVAKYFPAFLDGTDCNKLSPSHFRVELMVPRATDDVGVAGYVIYVDAWNASAPLYRALAEGDADAAAIQFDVIHLEELTECYRVHAVDLAGNESEALAPVCLPLSMAAPEYVPDGCNLDAGPSSPADGGPVDSGPTDSGPTDSGPSDDDAGTLDDAGEVGAPEEGCACVSLPRHTPAAFTALLLLGALLTRRRSAARATERRRQGSHAPRSP